MQPSDARFLSFAFASADLLFETDLEGRIAFALGATRGLADGADKDLVGRNWRSLVVEADRSLVSALLDHLKVGARCGPVRIRLAAGRKDEPAYARLNACRLPGNERRIACTLSRAAPPADAAAGAPLDGEARLLDGKAFAALATEIAGRANSYEPSAQMMLLELPELTAIRSRLPEASAADLLRKIGTLINLSSVDGRSAGRLSETRFGLIHQGGADALPGQIAEVARALDPAGEGTQVAHAELSLAPEGLKAPHAVRSIRYALASFAEKGADGAPDAAAAFERIFAETAEKMERFETRMRCNDFEYHYQPIVSLESGAVHHYEMLVRFEKGASPAETIRFAEELGLIQRVDLACCSHAADLLEARRDSLKLAVNVSGESLTDPAFVTRLVALLGAKRAIAPRLFVEVTESAAIRDLAAAAKAVDAIRRLGPRVCLDDFGAGAASFPYLQALSVDFVKIDGAYVKRLGQSRRDDAMLRGMVRLCVDLEVGIIAEMIETEEQATALRELGIGLGQGYFFGRPEATPAAPEPYRRPQRAAVSGRRRGVRETWE
ncbi:MAG: EAL domain-containing protein [Alphaproteobacteria bacterium]|nr:EAL domain-containing protein [Alphaproteobacteria bacterium]